MMQRHLHIVALLTLALAAYLRLYRVDQTPGWFSDEGTHLAIARSLQAGQVQYLALIKAHYWRHDCHYLNCC